MHMFKSVLVSKRKWAEQLSIRHKSKSLYPTKQAAMRSELASRFSTATGAPTAAEASKAPRAAAFNENFMVNLRSGEKVEGAGRGRRDRDI